MNHETPCISLRITQKSYHLHTSIIFPFTIPGLEIRTNPPRISELKFILSKLNPHNLSQETRLSKKRKNITELRNQEKKKKRISLAGLLLWLLQIRQSTEIVTLKQRLRSHLPLEPPNIIQPHQKLSYGGLCLLLVREEQSLQ